MRIGIVIATLLLVWIQGRAQDAQFSQFYANPVLINPAFIGNTIQSRFTANYRNQWAGVPNSTGFTTYAFGYEHNMENYNSGIGLQFLHDRAGTGALRTTTVMLGYAYRIRVTRHFSIKTGLQFGVGNRFIDFSELTFNDQLQTGSNVSSAEADFRQAARYYMDINVGAIGYTRMYYFGVSLLHLNRPDISLLGNGVRIPVKFHLHGGYKIPVKRDIKKRIKSEVTIAANYKHEGNRDQLDIGGYFNYKPVMFGLWYRGIPLKNIEPQFINNDAIVILVGYNKDGFALGYSFDLTVSKLTAATSGGAHEVSVKFEFASRKNQRKRRRRSRFMIPCPKF
ncbi:type IX secretion system membrane protein PorP/SprF [bacterium SCSIO 12741]|nr:type IX secretion system membrane protein PorP/SprF [bacterium SCSIO 12741]